MKKLFSATPIIIFLSAITVFSQASISVTQAADAARQSTTDIKNRSMELERMVREARGNNASSNKNNLKFPEIKEDFERIQIVNTNSLQIPSAKENPDYKAIFKAILEIKKRASRLKTNLFPVLLKEDIQKESIRKYQEKSMKKEMKALAIEIDNTLFSFVSNNIFQNIKLVDLKDSQKAETDLEKIIALCSVIETKIKSVEKSS